MISLYDLIDASNGQLFGEPAAQLFDDFCLDASQAEPGKLFIARRNDLGDTHQHIPEAIANGVSGVVCSQPPACDTTDVSVVLVRDTMDALMTWAHYILGKFGTKVIGVTGSSGKSTTMSAIQQVLSTRYPVHVAYPEETGRLSIPLSLAQLSTSDQFVVLQMDSYQPGEMGAMVQAVQPDVGVILHIDTIHTSRFETPQQLARESAMLIDYLSPGGLAVLNYDDDLVRSMGGNTRAEVRTVGINSFGADVMAHNISTGRRETRFDLRHNEVRFTNQRAHLLGKHNLYCLLAAYAVGIHYEIPPELALEAATSVHPVQGRMNPLRGKGGCLLVDDTYNAMPHTTLAALNWMQEFKDKPGRLFFVFADMENLGKNSQIGHRIIGQRAAPIVDRFITQGTNAALSARAALDHGMEPAQARITYAPQDTASALMEIDLGPDDIVLLKGGAGARLEQVTQALLEQSDDREQLIRQTSTRELVTLKKPARLTSVEINANAIAANTHAIKEMIGDEVTLMAVVKADAYGHGAVMTAQTALLNGADYLGVSSIQEGLELRAAGIKEPILVMNYTPVHMLRQAIHHDLTITLYDMELTRTYDRIARELNGRIRAHLKIDTGMGRLGVLPSETMIFFRHLMNMINIEVEGIYTHFSCADTDPDYTNKQLSEFKTQLRNLQASTGYKFKYIHACNSAATIAYSEAHFNMVRVGLALYGMHPSDTVRLPDIFSPAMTWKTSVAQVKKLPAGHPVGYGNTYITSGPETIAILPVGYADGFRRGPQNWGEVLIHGRRAPVIGRVSMEKTAINVSDIPGVLVDDEVVLLGRQGDETITAEEISARLGTINYEVTCSVLPRIPRR